jgi:hypothetical protein
MKVIFLGGMNHNPFLVVRQDKVEPDNRHDVRLLFFLPAERDG